MKISYSLYELICKRPIETKKTYTSRKGALLQVELEDGHKGYADCHPWEELGDLPLQTQLDLLKDGRCTRLTARSIHFAKADAFARSKKQNLLESRKIPMSHYLISKLDRDSLNEINSASGDGFTHFKIKLGNDIAKEEELLREIVKNFPKLKLRLDFNNKLTNEQFISFLDHWTSLHQMIDFVEDPFPFNYATWRQVQETFKVALAADEHYKAAYGHPEAAKVLIMKPAIHTLKPIDMGQRLVVTSYLDHPLGQMSAAYMASFACEEPCGLLSQHTYQSNPYAEMIEHKGPWLKGVKGHGFGFDELLKKQVFVPV